MTTNQTLYDLCKAVYDGIESAGIYCIDGTLYRVYESGMWDKVN